MTEDMDEAIGKVQDAYEAFNRGDFDSAARFVHPDIVFHRVADVESTLQGRDAVRANMEPEIFATQHGEVLSTEVIADCVVCRVDFTAKGAGSGIEMSDDAWHLWRMKDGKAIEFRYFDSRDEAVAAADS